MSDHRLVTKLSQLLESRVSACLEDSNYTNFNQTTEMLVLKLKNLYYLTLNVLFVDVGLSQNVSCPINKQWYEADFFPPAVNSTKTKNIPLFKKV